MRPADQRHAPSWLARLLARLRGGARPRLRHHDGLVSLQFARRQTQSRMRADDPDYLLIDYTRTMLAVLLLQPAARRVGMVGFGGGSQAKFLHRHAPWLQVEAVENNAGVLALREDFGVPPDDDRLRVVLGDGAAFVADRPAAFDLLLVDGYDLTGIPAVLSTAAFYRDCHAALADGGAMSVNLYGVDHAAHVAHLRAAFGDACVAVVEEPKMSNRVAFAWRGARPACAGADAAAPRIDADATAAATRVDAVLARFPPVARNQLAACFRRAARTLPV